MRVRQWVQFKVKDLPQKISLVSSQEVCEPYLHIPEDNPEGENQVHVLYLGIHVSLTFEVFKCSNGKDGLELDINFSSVVSVSQFYKSI